jgi:hypothetical protein
VEQHQEWPACALPQLFWQSLFTEHDVHAPPAPELLPLPPLLPLLLLLPLLPPLPPLLLPLPLPLPFGLALPPSSPQPSMPGLLGAPPQDGPAASAAETTKRTHALFMAGRLPEPTVLAVWLETVWAALDWVGARLIGVA